MDKTLAPAGALDHERPLAPYYRLNRFALPVAEVRTRPEHPLEELLK
ncbi:MAG: hypothetical protein ABIQ17_05460 [Candidatus Limnocylindrales bacterium]